MFSHFDPSLMHFLKTLASNNDREWFNDHKQDYEDKVRTPALAFIGQMDHWVPLVSPHYEANAKKVGGSLMRVYRDAIEHKPFTEHYELAGDKLIRPPKGYDPDHPMIEELKRKDFIALCRLEEKELYADDLCERVASRFGRAQPLQQFMCEALGLRF
jgi:uncharacterized protein (DUF2461 family)